MKTEEVVRALAADLEPVRRLRRVGSRALLWAALALAFVAGGSWALGPRADLLQKLSDPSYLAETAVLLAVFVLGSRSAFRLSVPGLERGWIGRVAPAAGLAAWVLLVVARYPAEQPMVDGLGCIANMTALGLIPAVAALRMLRTGAPMESGWAGAHGALAAASLAMLGVHSICAHDGPAHVMVFHVLPVAAVALLGAVVGRIFLRAL